MSWRKAKAALQKKPYLIDPYRLRSVSAAEEVVSSAALPEPEAVFEQVRVKLNLSAEEWQGYLASDVDRREKAAPAKRNSLVVRPRRLLVALAVLLLAIMLMACTPMGRAWLIAAYNAVTEVINGILYVRTDDKPSDLTVPETLDISETTIELNDLHSIVEQIDKPVFYLASRGIKSSDFMLTRSYIYGEYLQSTYTLENGTFISIRQDWEQAPEERLVLDETKEHVKVHLENGLVVDGAYSEDDLCFVGAAVTDGTRVRIVIQGINKNGIADVLKAISTEQGSGHPPTQVAENCVEVQN